MDAPFHYHPTIDLGTPALTIDQVPLDWCFQDSVVLDFSHKPDGERITTEDVDRKLAEIEYHLKPLDIVLVRTGADAFWGKPEYLIKGAGMTRELGFEPYTPDETREVLRLKGRDRVNM